VKSAAVTIASSTRPLLSQTRCLFLSLISFPPSHPWEVLPIVSEAWMLCESTTADAARGVFPQGRQTWRCDWSRMTPAQRRANP
jgi:hypothetical protein